MTFGLAAAQAHSGKVNLSPSVANIAGALIFRKVIIGAVRTAMLNFGRFGIAGLISGPSWILAASDSLGRKNNSRSRLRKRGAP